MCGVSCREAERMSMATTGPFYRDRGDDDAHALRKRGKKGRASDQTRHKSPKNGRDVFSLSSVVTGWGTAV